MTTFPQSAELGVTVTGHVAVLEIRRPPHNYFDLSLVSQIADALDVVDATSIVRSVVLCARGKSFCAGADLQRKPDTGRTQEAPPGGKQLYKEAMRIFRARKPMVAAVHGAAIGGGCGLALAADFRVTCKKAYFITNFARLGLHQGFGISVTLPRLVGAQKAAMLLYTARRLGGEEAVGIGLADVLAEQDDVGARALALAREIAASAPLAVLSIRETMRRGLADAVEAATERELVEQEWLRRTEDFKEGVSAWAEKRQPDFKAC